MQHHHYDLDQIEKDIRAMFVEARAIPIPPDPGDALMHTWQNKSEDVRVHFARFLHDMINHGLSDQEQGYVVGVIMADCASDFLGGYDLSQGAGPLSMVMTALTNHINQVVARLIIDPDRGPRCPINPVTSGRA